MCRARFLCKSLGEVRPLGQISLGGRRGRGRGPWSRRPNNDGRACIRGGNRVQVDAAARQAAEGARAREVGDGVRAAREIAPCRALPGVEAAVALQGAGVARGVSAARSVASVRLVPCVHQGKSARVRLGRARETSAVWTPAGAHRCACADAAQSCWTGGRCTGSRGRCKRAPPALQSLLLHRGVPLPNPLQHLADQADLLVRPKEQAGS